MHVETVPGFSRYYDLAKRLTAGLATDADAIVKGMEAYESKWKTALLTVGFSTVDMKDGDDVLLRIEPHFPGRVLLFGYDLQHGCISGIGSEFIAGSIGRSPMSNGELYVAELISPVYLSVHRGYKKVPIPPIHLYLRDSGDRLEVARLGPGCLRVGEAGASRWIGI
jgi:hypothetical protein